MSEPVRRMLVAYDIVDDRRRDRVAVALQEHGERVQYSVFLVDGRPATFVRLRSALGGLIDLDVDTVMFCDLGNRESAVKHSIAHIGKRRPLTGDSTPSSSDAVGEHKSQPPVSRNIRVACDDTNVLRGR